MIWHQEKQMGPPKKSLLPVPDSIEQPFSNRRQGELIMKAFAAIDGDKINFPARIHPGWNVMGQMFLARTIHKMGSKTIASDLATMIIG